MGKFRKKRVIGRLFRGSKKGVSDVIIDFWAYIIYILFIIIFFIIFNFQQKAIENKVTTNYETLKTDYDLSLYLRSPVNVDVNKDGNLDIITFGEYVAYCHSDATFCDGLKQKTEEFFDKILFDGWNMKINSDTINMKLGHNYGWSNIKKFFTNKLIGIATRVYYDILPYDDRIIALQEIPSWDGKSVTLEFSNWVVFGYK